MTNENPHAVSFLLVSAARVLQMEIIMKSKKILAAAALLLLIIFLLPLLPERKNTEQENSAALSSSGTRKPNPAASSAFPDSDELNTALFNAVDAYDSAYPADVSLPGSTLLWPSRIHIRSDRYGILSQGFTFSQVYYNADSGQFEINFDRYQEELLDWFRHNILDDDRIILTESLFSSDLPEEEPGNQKKKLFTQSLQNYILEHPGSAEYCGTDRFLIQRPLAQGSDLIQICSIRTDTEERCLVHLRILNKETENWLRRNICSDPGILYTSDIEADPLYLTDLSLESASLEPEAAEELSIYMEQTLFPSYVSCIPFCIHSSSDAEYTLTDSSELQYYDPETGWCCVPARYEQSLPCRPADYSLSPASPGFTANLDLSMYAVLTPGRYRFVQGLLRSDQTQDEPQIYLGVEFELCKENLQ